MKEIPHFDENLKEYFLPESGSYMKLDENLINKGN